MYFFRFVSAFTNRSNFLAGLPSPSFGTATVSAGKYLSPPSLSNGMSLAVKSSQIFWRRVSCIPSNIDFLLRRRSFRFRLQMDRGHIRLKMDEKQNTTKITGNAESPNAGLSVWGIVGRVRLISMSALASVLS